MSWSFPYKNSATKRSPVAKWVVGSLIVGLVAGGLFLSADSAGAALKLQDLKARNKELLRANEHLRFIHDLAVEFGMSPYLVEVVDHYSRKHVDSRKTEWRLIRTPEYMTYLMLSVIQAESRGKVKAVGDGGRARGLTQIWLSTAQQYGKVTARELLDPETNIKFAFQHFHALLKRYRGNLALALYAWNRGSGKVDQLIHYGEIPSNGYGRKVYRAALDDNTKLFDTGD